VELLLMDTLVAARRQKRVVVYEPLAPPSVCPKCSAAYAEARRVIEEAGGLAA
jgi:hypothetical protein